MILADGNYQRLGWEVPTALRPSNPEQYQFALGPNDGAQDLDRVTPLFLLCSRSFSFMMTDCARRSR